MPAPLSPGARWLAAVAGHTGMRAALRFWRVTGDAPVPPAAIPIGGHFHLVRVSVPAAEAAWHHLQSAAATIGPVLAHGHTWDFFVPTDLRDGRDIPRGCLLTGTASPQVVLCPFPGAPATPSLTWINPPDGSQNLNDPKDLAIALAASSEARLPAGQRWRQRRATP